MSQTHPEQVAGVEVNEVADGIVLYQSEPDRVHYLNATAMLVFELCTGANSNDEIAQMVGTAFGLDTPPEDEVMRCLVELRERGVIA